MDTQLITITQEEYDYLVKDSRFLRALENAGVDNWAGYDIACEEVYGDDE